MGNHVQKIKDMTFTLMVIVLVFFLNVLMQKIFDTKSLIPMIFVLGVFTVSLKTHGYFWGIAASLLSVLAVNYAFTFPYYAIDLISPECVLSAVVMLIVSTMTCTLTTKIKMHEKSKAEAEKEKMRANLLRAVSHDLRTPLTSIYGSCSAIMDNYDYLTKEQHLKHLGEIREDSEWLIRMVENLLSVTRIDGDRVKVKKTPIVLEELIDVVLVKFRKRSPGKNIEVEIPEEFVIIPMDAMLIEQVIVNILDNAVIHAKGMTKIELKVSIEGNDAKFEITDDGCGIPSDKIKNLFAGYFDRAGDVADGNRSNMGIGLSVCSTIIKAHGGEIHVCNREEGGSSFSFTLPMEESDE